MSRITILISIVFGCTLVNAGLVLAESTVVVGAGIAAEPRTANQFEYAVAAACGHDAEGEAIAGGLIDMKFVSSDHGIETVNMEVSDVKVITDRETGRQSAELGGTANVKLRNGRRFSDTPIRMFIIEYHSICVELELERIGLVSIDAVVFSGGNSFGAMEPEALVVALGEGTTVESVFQAAVAIDAEGRAMGRLSLLANRDNGDVVRVDGAVDGAAVRPNVGRRRLQLHLAGVAAVDVFPPDGNSPDTCFGDFSFVANEGPHGPFRIDVPDCRDPLAGIEGSDIGSGNVAITGS